MSTLTKKILKLTIRIKNKIMKFLKIENRIFQIKKNKRIAEKISAETQYMPEGLYNVIYYEFFVKNWMDIGVAVSRVFRTGCGCYTM